MDGYLGLLKKTKMKEVEKQMANTILINFFRRKNCILVTDLIINKTKIV